jgi:SOS-response transcriptional repressor LexA
MYEFIKAHKAENDGMAPSRDEIAEQFGISATAVVGTLKLIEKKGYVRLFEGIPRGIRVLK